MFIKNIISLYILLLIIILDLFKLYWLAMRESATAKSVLFLVPLDILLFTKSIFNVFVMFFSSSVKYEKTAGDEI
jgi:hypothetical protein